MCDFEKYGDCHDVHLRCPQCPARRTTPTMTSDPSPGSAALAAFLREAAIYFERRPTNDEDMAFWSNVTNAENCRKAALLLDGVPDALPPTEAVAGPAAVVQSNPPAATCQKCFGRGVVPILGSYFRGGPVELPCECCSTPLLARPAAGVGEVVVLPKALTAENGAKYALIGEFKFPITITDSEGDERSQMVAVPWDIIKDIHKRVVELFAAPTPAASPADGLVAYLDTLNGVLKNAGVDLTALGMEWPTAIAHKYRAAASPDWQVVREALVAAREWIVDETDLGANAPICKLIDAALASPPIVAGWRPLLENGVRPKGRVLLWKERTKEHYVASWTHGDHPGWCTPDGFEIFGATHWQPLPSAPIPEGPK